LLSVSVVNRHHIFLFMSGSNCSEQIRAELYKVDNVPFRCEVELIPLSNELSVSDLFHVKPAFDAMSGTAG